MNYRFMHVLVTCMHEKGRKSNFYHKKWKQCSSLYIYGDYVQPGLTISPSDLSEFRNLDYFTGALVTCRDEEDPNKHKDTRDDTAFASYDIGLKKVKVSYLTWVVYESPHLVWMERLVSSRAHGACHYLPDYPV